MPCLILGGTNNSLHITNTHCVHIHLPQRKVTYKRNDSPVRRINSISPLPQGHTPSGSAMTASNPCWGFCKSRPLRSLLALHQCSVVSSEGVSRDLTWTYLSSLGFVLSVWFILRSRFLVFSFIFHLFLSIFLVVFILPIVFLMINLIIFSCFCASSYFRLFVSLYLLSAFCFLFFLLMWGCAGKGVAGRDQAEGSRGRAEQDRPEHDGARWGGESTGVGVGSGWGARHWKRKEKNWTKVISTKSSTSKAGIRPLPVFAWITELAALSTKEKRISENKWLSKHSEAYLQETNTRVSFEVVLSCR